MGEYIDDNKDDNNPVQETRLREDVTAAEYQAALQTLRDFASADVARVSTIDDLRQVTQGIGPALRAAIVSHPDSTLRPGRVWRETRDGEEHILRSEPECTLRKNIDENGGLLNLAVRHHNTSDQEFVDLSAGREFDPKNYGSTQEQLRALFHSGYGARIFADKPIQVTGDGTVGSDLETYELLAYETRAGDTQRTIYRPLLQLHDPEAQRSYARILQTCVRDVLTLNPPPPTPIPPGIAN